MFRLEYWTLKRILWLLFILLVLVAAISALSWLYVDLKQSVIVQSLWMFA